MKLSDHEVIVTKNELDAKYLEIKRIMDELKSEVNEINNAPIRAAAKTFYYSAAFFVGLLVNFANSRLRENK